MEQIIFWLLASGSVIAALAVVVPPMGRNPVHSALSLVICFFFLAGLYVMLVAHLVAVLQILVYAGAIVVLFLFVIMLLNIRKEELGAPRITLFKMAGFSAVLLILYKLATGFLSSTAGTDTGAVLAQDSTFGSVKTNGTILYTEYLLAFELVSILLLVAIIGAVVMAKKRL